MKYCYKVLNKDKCRNGVKYKSNTLVTDPLPFYPRGNCEPGGLYFASKDILAFLDYGPYIVRVSVPDGDQVYTNPGSTVKYKAHRLKLGKIEKITGKVITRMLKEGADVHAGNDYAIQWASINGYLEVVRVLLKAGADVHADDDYALQWASFNGHVEVVKVLLKAGADVHAEGDYALRWASERGHMEVAKVLKKAMCKGKK